MKKKSVEKNKTNNEYDVVIIGAGNGGLMAAATCAKYKLKTLLIEQHNIPGGFASSFVRGRFEFETALHELGNLGNSAVPGTIYKCFKELGIEVKWHKAPEAFTIVSKDEFGKQIKYKLPTGVDNFINECERIYPGCKNKVRKFIDICENCYHAVYTYIPEARGNIDPKILKSKYPNYLTVATYSISDVLKKLKMPSIIKFIIESYWIYFGVKPDELDANLYAIAFYEYIKFGAYIPNETSYEISQSIADRFIELGGTIWYNTRAEEIVVENNKVIGCKTNNGYINTKHIICNASPQIVYSKMINNDQVPELAKKLFSWREPGSQGLCVFLGLNKSLDFFKLTDYSYFVFSCLDHNKIYDNTRHIDTNCEYIAIALNNANKNASEEGTSIISFTTLYQDAWKNVTEKDYFKLKNKIANKFVTDFEQKFNVNIRDYIEEIEVATPVTFARYTKSLNGAIYGFKCDTKDSVLTRGYNLEKYEVIDGLKFCGAHGFSTHGYSITYFSGTVMAGRTFLDIKKERGE